MGAFFPGVIPIANGTAANPGLPFATMPNTGFYKAGPAGVGLSVAGMQTFEIDAGGMTIGPTVPSNGVPAQISGSPYALNGVELARSVALSPNGQYLVVANDQGAYNVHYYVYTVNSATGQLTPVANSPFTPTLGSAAYFPHRMRFTPDGRYLIVLHLGVLNVSVYDFFASLASGSWVEITGSPYSTGAITASFYGEGLSISPNGSFLYVAASDITVGNKVYGWTINKTTGQLTAIAGSPWNLNAATTNTQCVVSPDNAHLYVINQSNSNIDAYVINSVTGALTGVVGSPFAMPNQGFGVDVSPDGSWLLIGGAAGDIEVYARNSGTGALTLNPALTVNLSSATPIRDLRIDTNGTDVVCVQPTPNLLHALSFTSSTGVLAGKTGSPFTVGSSPYECVIQSLGQIFYCTNLNSHNISGYSTLSQNHIPLLTATFDPTGGLNGTYNINGNLTVQGKAIAADPLKGVTNGAEQVIGDIGEVQIAQLLQANAAALTTTTPLNLTSLTLTPGVWEVTGQIAFIPAATTTVDAALGGIGTVSNTLPSADSSRVGLTWNPAMTIGNAGVPVTPAMHINPLFLKNTVNTTVYLVGYAKFSTSTMSAFGQLVAKRIR